MTKEKVIERIRKSQQSMRCVINCAEEAVDCGIRAIACLAKNDFKGAEEALEEACKLENQIHDQLFMWHSTNLAFTELKYRTCGTSESD